LDEQIAPARVIVVAPQVAVRVDLSVAACEAFAGSAFRCPTLCGDDGPKPKHRKTKQEA
jgi:hypothetical protein